jgi:hypothetical protein
VKLGFPAYNKLNKLIEFSKLNIATSCKNAPIEAGYLLLYKIGMNYTTAYKIETVNVTFGFKEGFET